MKIRFCKILIPLSSILFSTSAFADSQPFKPEDFAAGREISTVSKASFYEFELPEEIYLSVIRTDLGDIRIFNAENNIVPHILVRPVVTVEPQRNEITLPVFPVQSITTSKKADSKITLVQNASGNLTSVFIKSSPLNNLPIKNIYLVDARKFNVPIQNLEFDWESRIPNQVIPIQIEGSNDLNTWYPISKSAVLARLAIEGQSIDQNLVTINSQRTNFIKITAEPEAELTINGIKGVSVEGVLLTSEPKFRTIYGLVDLKDSKTLNFDAGGLFPFSSLGIVPKDLNTFFRATVFSHKKMENGVENWNQRYSGMFYRLTAGDREVNSKVQNISETNDRYWKVAVQGKDTVVSANSFSLKLGWVPHKLIFLAGGAPPFRVAYGSSKVNFPDFGITQLDDFVKNSGERASEAQLGNLIKLGGADKLEKESNWQSSSSYFLWGILIFFIVILFRMSMKLAKELKETNYE